MFTLNFHYVSYLNLSFDMKYEDSPWKLPTRGVILIKPATSTRRGQDWEALRGASCYLYHRNAVPIHYHTLNLNIRRPQIIHTPIWIYLTILSYRAGFFPSNFNLSVLDSWYKVFSQVEEYSFKLQNFGQVPSLHTREEYSLQKTFKITTIIAYFGLSNH